MATNEGSIVSLAPAERAELRHAIDAERRRRLGQFAHLRESEPLCEATAQSGRRCRNVARFGPWCGVHRGGRAQAA